MGRWTQTPLTFQAVLQSRLTVEKTGLWLGGLGKSRCCDATGLCLLTTPHSLFPVAEKSWGWAAQSRWEEGSVWVGLDLAAAFGLPCGGLGADSGPSSLGADVAQRQWTG